MRRVRIGWSTNENDAVWLCPQAYNNLLPGSVSWQLDYYTLKVTAVVSAMLTAADIQEQAWASHWFSFGIAIRKVPGTNPRQWLSAGSQIYVKIRRGHSLGILSFPAWVSWFGVRLSHSLSNGGQQLTAQRIDWWDAPKITAPLHTPLGNGLCVTWVLLHRL